MLKQIVAGTVVMGVLGGTAMLATGISVESLNSWVTAGEVPDLSAFVQGPGKKPGPPKHGAKKPGPPHGKGPAGPGKKLPPMLHLPPHVELTKAQREQVEELVKEYLPQIKSLDEARKAIFSKEQEEARKAAHDEARALGFKGPEAKRYEEQAVELTPSQKDILKDWEAERKSLDEEIRAELLRLLTRSQVEQLGPKFRPKGKDKPKPGQKEPK